MLHNRRSHCNETPVHHNQSSPHSLQLEKILCSNNDPAQLINKLKKKRLGPNDCSAEYLGLGEQIP